MFDFKTLKDKVSGMFEKSTDAETLKKLGVVLNDIDECEKERNQLVKENDDIRKSYIDVVKGASFKPNKDDVNDNNGESHDFEYYLNEEGKKLSK